MDTPAPAPDRSSIGKAVAPVAIAMAAYLLWETPLLFPLRMFVVFLHELSHGLAAVATGGSIVSIELSSDEGGLCTTLGGSSFVTLSAGYLGSAAWGAGLLVAGSRTRHDRELCALLGGILLLITVVYVRTIFGFVYGLATAVLLVAIPWKLRPSASDLTLRVIGVVSCLYAIYDIASDLLLRSVPSSDASALARLTGVPSFVWAAAWILVALASACAALVLSVRGPRP